MIPSGQQKSDMATTLSLRSVEFVYKKLDVTLRVYVTLNDVIINGNPNYLNVRG